MPEGAPTYMIHGGFVFDQMADAPAGVQALFLSILSDLLRDPKGESIDAVQAREMGEENRYIANREGVMVNYIVIDGPPGHVFVIDALWV